MNLRITLDVLLDRLPDLRLAKAVEDHTAWLSVDYMQVGDEEHNLDQAYSFIVRLILELADESTLALFHPETGRMNYWNDEVIGNLLRPGGLENFTRMTEVPVSRVASDDEALAAATAKAKERWPEFLAAYEERTPDDSFGVKVPITAGGNTEHIWVAVTGLEPEYVHGTLGNDPLDLGDLKFGSVVEVPVDDVEDWYYTIGDVEPVGIFSLKAVTKEF